jgi:hypothetical protein
MGIAGRLLDVKLNDRSRRLLPTSLRKWFRLAKFHALVVNREVRDATDNRLARLVKALRKPRPAVLFYPEVPRSTCPVYQFCLVRGFRMTNNIDGRWDLAVRWKDATIYQPEPALTAVARSTPVVNINCNDISKSRVDALFAELFGYSSIVDPRSHAGPCVFKSERNGVHDGEIVECPVAHPREGIYQVLIDNQVDDEYVLDIRVPIIGTTIPFVLLWHKPIDDRFGHWVSHQVIAAVDDVFSAGEQSRMLAFAQRMGLDYGDLDVLRDRATGRMYIIDANNTPDWERPALPDPGDDVKQMAVVFSKVFGLEQETSGT